MSDDDSEGSESPVPDFDSMTDTEVMEWHQSRCDRGALWAHGFERYFYGDGEADHESIEKPRHRITKLFTTENWRSMGEYIHYDETDEPPCAVVHLSDCGLTAEHAEALFGGERPCRCPIKWLDLSKNPLGPRGLNAMLQNASRSMGALDLRDCNLGLQGGRLLSEALNHIRIERLSIANCRVGEEVIEPLLSATNTAFLEELYIHNNPIIGPRGISAIRGFLRRDDTALKKLVMQCYDGYASALFGSISLKSKLEELHLWNATKKQSVLPPSAVSSVLNLVCNTNSLESIIRSNHLLKNVGSEPPWTPMYTEDDSLEIMKKALMINRRAEDGASLNQMIRSKLREFYFHDYCLKEKAFDVQPFVGLDIALMPHLMELVTRTESTFDGRKYVSQCDGNIGSVYHLIKNCDTAALFSFHSQPTKTQQLEAEVVRLKEKNGELSREIDELRAGQIKVQHLEEENERLRKQIAELQASRSDLPNKRARAAGGRRKR